MRLGTKFCIRSVSSNVHETTGNLTTETVTTVIDYPHAFVITCFLAPRALSPPWTTNLSQSVTSINIYFLLLPNSPFSTKRSTHHCNETGQAFKGKYDVYMIINCRECLENNASSGCSKLHLFFFGLSIFVLYCWLHVLMTEDILSIPDLEMC